MVQTDKARSDAGFFRLGAARLPAHLLSAMAADPGMESSRKLLPLGGSGRTVTYPVLLSCLFLMAFALPVAVAAHIGGFFSAESRTEQREDLFPDAVSAMSQDYKIEITNHPALQPQEGDDFLEVGWFKFRKFPANGERILLLSKSENWGKNKTGYALGLSGEEGGRVRPILFWGGADGGRWYRFTDIDLPHREWIMFGLSLREGRYLGLHVAIYKRPGKADLRLLGGYDLESIGYLGNDHPLAVGAPAMSRFSGRVGPIGIFHRQKLTEDLQDILKRLSRFPLESPALFDSDEVGLWWTGSEQDLSDYKHRVSVSGEKKEKRESSAMVQEESPPRS